MNSNENNYTPFNKNYTNSKTHHMVNSSYIVNPGYMNHSNVDHSLVTPIKKGNFFNKSNDSNIANCRTGLTNVNLTNIQANNRNTEYVVKQNYLNQNKPNFPYAESNDYCNNDISYLDKHYDQNNYNYNTPPESTTKTKTKENAISDGSPIKSKVCKNFVADCPMTVMKSVFNEFDDGNSPIKISSKRLSFNEIEQSKTSKELSEEGKLIQELRAIYLSYFIDEKESNYEENMNCLFNEILSNQYLIEGICGQISASIFEGYNGRNNNLLFKYMVSKVFIYS